MRPTARRPVKLTTGTSLCCSQRRARVRPVAAHDIHHAARQSGFGQNLHQVVGRKRRIFGRLDHHGVSADQRRHHLPRRNRHRKIPRRDHPAHADGLPHAHRKFIRQLRRSGLAKQPAPFAGHVIGHVDGFLHVAARLRQDLAHLARHVRANLPCAAPAAPRRGTESPRAWAPAPAATICTLLRPTPPRPRPHSKRKLPDPFVGIRRVAVFICLPAPESTHSPLMKFLYTGGRCRSHTSSKIN